jgi:FAD/FMN-containing dehydrogenase
VVAADVVTADGRKVRASEDEEPELLWGLRGGGGNFGIVTAFEFALHPVGPMVLAGAVVHPIERTRELFGFWRDWIGTIPDALTSIAAVFTCPPEPEYPAELHGRHVSGIIVNWVGPHEEGEQVLAPLRAFGPPAVDLIRPTPFVELQSSQDEKFAWGRRYYNKNAYLDRLDDEVIDRCVAHIVRVRSPLSAVAILHMGAAVSRVRPHETAYPNRDAQFNLDITSIWTDPDEDADQVGWVRGFHADVSPFASAGEYVNTTSMDGRRDVRAAYGENWPRLVALKDRWDPTNFFRLNQNIEPSSVAVER